MNKNKIYIPQFIPYKEQSCRVGYHEWSVPRLIELSKDLPIMEIPLAHMFTYHKYPALTNKELLMHMQAILNADLKYPIILDEDGEIMDGRHRLMKAMHLKKKQ